jgi:chromosome segregation and condensation protein ScpB
MNRRKQFEELLTQHAEGLSARQLSRITKLEMYAIRKTLAVMPNVYIDRWCCEESASGLIDWEPVFCVQPTPLNAPYPARPPTRKDLCQEPLKTND